MPHHESVERSKNQSQSRSEQAKLKQAATPNASMVQRAQLDPNRLQPGDVAALQRSVGNAAVANILGRNSSTSQAAPTIQRKLEVGPANDKFEREADEIARSVQRSPVPQVQRAPVGPEGGAVSGDLEKRLRQSQSSGSSLPGGVRRAIEPKLGADLSSVKVHTDSNAVQLSKEFGAKAFTHKNHIYYGAGHSPNDLKLTAHEAVHTVQQGAVRRKRMVNDNENT